MSITYPYRHNLSASSRWIRPACEQGRLIARLVLVSYASRKLGASRVRAVFKTLRSAPLSCMSGGRLSGAFKGCARGWGVVLNVSQNASEWMLKKGYAVNGVARIKHYEGVTAPCDAGGKGCSRVQVSSSRKSCELLTVCTLPHSVNRALSHGVRLSMWSHNGRGARVRAVACVLVSH